MNRLIPMLAIVLTGVLWLPAAAQAEFGINGFDVTYTNQDGSPATQAGSHPFAMTTSFGVNYMGVGSEAFPDGEFKDLTFEQIVGLAGDTTAYPRCATADFLSTEGQGNKCPADTALGITGNRVIEPTNVFGSAVFNLTPPPGVLVRLGFRVVVENIVVDIGIRPSDPYNPAAYVRNAPQLVYIFGNKTQIWGNPSDSVHDGFRGNCYGQASVVSPSEEIEFENQSGKSCSVQPRGPFLTLPTSCDGPAFTSYEAFSWEGATDNGGVLTHDNAEPPVPQSFTNCGLLGFAPLITAKPTTRAAQSPTGLDFSLDVHDEGLPNPVGLAQSDIKKAVVTLPEGFTTNPSIAEGLGVCSEAELTAETLDAAPGQGCPDASKVGTVEVESPLVEESIKGSLFIAKPYENEFNSLLALYIVLKSPALGIIVKQAAEVTPDPVTGQLTTTTENMPQLPFSHFNLHFREGTRSPLASPPGCGKYNAEAELTPWSGGEPITTTSTFQIISGPDSGPCPTGGLPLFHPGLIAGTLNNAAGRFSPFNVRLSRADSEQEITHFSIKLPPGITGKLAGVPLCSDAAIAAAKARTGPHGGQEELNTPSCPAASQIGRTLVGSGVGPSLAYAPGEIYLAGPYHGSPLSLVAITAGVVGPFDIGTVVVREAFKIDPETAEVFIDATGSDPIPHIIQGIPVHLRDIRAYTDKPEFVLNPTSCKRTSTASTLLGAGFNFSFEADDNPVTVSTPFQAADCAALPFKPKLSLKLIGGTTRGAHPKLVANLKMNGIGEAAIQRAQVTLPHSEFLENAHIKTICTRVQFKAGNGNGEQCPAGSIYGHAKAVTPILSDPLEGPIFLRSSEHQLPDLVAAFHNSEINVDLVGRIDSVKGGGIRNTFEAVPDAPVSSATFVFEGAGKGLLVNSTNLCKGTHKAEVNLDAHNGKSYDTRPALKVKCPKAKKHKRHPRHKQRAAR